MRTPLPPPRSPPGHTEFLDRIDAVREQLAAGRDCAVDLDRLAVFVTLVELILADFDMVGELRREGLLRT